jgi:hypothetical protein
LPTSSFSSTIDDGCANNTLEGVGRGIEGKVRFHAKITVGVVVVDVELVDVVDNVELVDVVDVVEDVVEVVELVVSQGVLCVMFIMIPNCDLPVPNASSARYTVYDLIAAMSSGSGQRTMPLISPIPKSTSVN